MKMAKTVFAVLFIIISTIIMSGFTFVLNCAMAISTPVTFDVVLFDIIYIEIIILNAMLIDSAVSTFKRKRSIITAEATVTALLSVSPLFFIIDGYNKNKEITVNSLAYIINIAFVIFNLCILIKACIPPRKIKEKNNITNETHRRYSDI